ncbi:hypothetical protein FNV43_RR22388 [Rhamnella rubrinervis]|uniref:GRAM domain-containing protein n=1 Tax=Rhamnella rubrinervis TaxID=2594499 RepID=A0A8K0DV45_9ROSA|nr:hypothetical protein FNV43_RR22388 [Rhamnella rubrinervis]
MNNTTTTNPESQPQHPHHINPFSEPLYPSISEPTSPNHQTPTNNSTTQESQPQLTSISAPKQNQTPAAPVPSSSSPKTQEDVFANPSSSSKQPPSGCNESSNAEKWGTHIMGHPAIPTTHPDNKKAALWGAPADQAHVSHYPYVHYSPIEKSSSNSPMESILHVFNSWSNKAESMANNIWHNLKTGSSVSQAAWGKMNLGAKAISGGGFESLYKQIFATNPNEKLKKTFACYLSTTTGPVAGTTYLSNLHVAFCSDRPLSFTAPSGQQTWSYYKVTIPLGNIGTVNPVVMRENPREKYIQIVTIDGHDFWFMGFVNYEKASNHLTQSVSTFVAPGIAAQVQKHNQ